MVMNNVLETIGVFIAQFGVRVWLIRILSIMILVVIFWEYLQHARNTLDGIWRAVMRLGERPEEIINDLRERQRERNARYPGDRSRDGGEEGQEDLEVFSEDTGFLAAPREKSSGSPEIGPIRTLEELLAYEKPGWATGFAPVRPLSPMRAFKPYRSRLLVCHDLAGGYGEDRLVQGGGYEQAYRMYDWGLIDVFVYFGHDFVIIPPAGWIDLAHRHGTRVLGTFITEWDKGNKICEDLLRSEEVADAAAARLTQIAVDHGFEGWLVNIENKIQEGHDVDVLVFFLKTLRNRMHDALRARGQASSSSTWYGPSGSGSSSPGDDRQALVLWYDSVTSDGRLAWQNQLNERNRRFFDACDGIFTNYHWRESYPSNCAHEAKGRRLDVYMGIDVWGRGTWGGGGFFVDQALGKIARAGVSAALFAPGWTMEKMTPTEGKVCASKGQTWSGVEREFLVMDDEFWSKISSAWAAPRAIPAGSSPAGDDGGLPFVVNFGRGVGDRWRVLGKEVAAFCPAKESDAGVGVSMNMTTKREVLGGAFYDLASQCVTPALTGKRIKGPWPHVFPARLNRGHGAYTTDGSFGLVGARYAYDKSFDGGSCLDLSGFLQDKATVSFSLFRVWVRCDVALPAEPLEVNVTFSSNFKSDIAIVLALDAPEHLDGRREVVLRDSGNEVLNKCTPLPLVRSWKPHAAHAAGFALSIEPLSSASFPDRGAGRLQGRPSGASVFSKRLTFTEKKASYSPQQEVSHGTAGRDLSSGESAEAGIRIRAMRKWSIPYEKIWTTLLNERGNLGPNPPEASPPVGDADGPEEQPAVAPLPEWTTRKYVVRDLRLGGSRAIRAIEVICGPRRVSHERDSSSGDMGGGDEKEWEVVKEPEETAAEEEEEELDFVLFNACLGELAIGPWQKEGSSTFREVKCFRATEVDVSGTGNEMVIDLSLEWELVPPARGLFNRPLAQPAKTRNALSWVLHWDLWEAVAGSGEGDEEWRWLGRAYGRKFRVRGLRLPAPSGGEVSFAAQQVNAMGHRQPMAECARLTVPISPEANL